jgi:hypothetical protein
MTAAGYFILRNNDNTIDKTTDTRIIDVIGMYTRVLGRSTRKSPGSFPNQERKPVE